MDGGFVGGRCFLTRLLDVRVQLPHDSDQRVDVTLHCVKLSRQGSGVALECDDVLPVTLESVRNRGTRVFDDS